MSMIHKVSGSLSQSHAILEHKWSRHSQPCNSKAEASQHGPISCMLRGRSSACSGHVIEVEPPITEDPRPWITYKPESSCVGTHTGTHVPGKRSAQCRSLPSTVRKPAQQQTLRRFVCCEQGTLPVLS
jgi:hypothetical protein